MQTLVLAEAAVIVKYCAITVEKGSFPKRYRDGKRWPVKL